MILSETGHGSHRSFSTSFLTTENLLVIISLVSV